MPDTASTVILPAFYPPTVRPPEEPLSLLPFLATFVRNPLRTIPSSVFHEPIVIHPAGRKVLAWVTDPALVETVLLRQAESFAKPPLETRVFGPALGRGILTAQGEEWRRQRKIASPTFRHNELLAYVPAIAAAFERLIDSWRASPGISTRAIEREMADVTFDVITSTVLSGCDAEEGSIIKSAAQEYLDGITWEIAFGIVELPEWLWHPRKRRSRRAVHSLREAVGRLVARRMAETNPGSDLLGRLTAARDAATGLPLSEALLVDNLATFLVAGHETTAKALTWALYLLTRVPEWQDRIRDEVASVAGQRPIAAADIESLTITTQVLKEAMRLYPPAPVLSRLATADVQLGPHRLPQGSLLLLPIYAIHRHRRLWTDPDLFDPGRFSPPREAAYRRAQYLPFGFGPRICIGQAFAMIEATVILASLVRAARFAWDGRSEPEPTSRVTLRPKNGMPLSVELI